MFFNKKGLSTAKLAIMFAVLYGLSTAGFYYYKMNNLPPPEEIVTDAISLLDSLSMKYNLNMDSLRNDSSFVDELIKNVSEGEIFERTFLYSDESIIEELGESIVRTTDSTGTLEPILVTDSMRMIVAKIDLIEERLYEYVENNKEEFKLEKENQDLEMKLKALQTQLDTVATQSSEIITGVGDQSDTIKQLQSENDELKEITKTLTNKNIAMVIKKYEAMKPQRAAQILISMPNEKVVKLLTKMKDRQAGKILAALPPQKSAELSLLMMEQNEHKK